MLRRLTDYAAAGLFLSVGWTLRGQFGHLKGALIPGALAAAMIVRLAGGRRWNAAAGRALVLGGLGFSVGGHMGFGRLVETVYTSNFFLEHPAEFARLFLTAAVWGGLGSTFLGFGFSEKKLGKTDYALFAALGLLWFVTLGILNLERFDLALFTLGFCALQLYNSLFKKSHAVTVFGFTGLAGFGFGLLAAVAALFLGTHDAFPAWSGRWWALRDEIWGFASGLALAWAARSLAGEGVAPAAVPRLRLPGYFFYAAFIPYWNAAHVFFYWHDHGLVSAAWMFAGCAAAAVICVAGYLAAIRSRRPLAASSIFYVAFLTLLALVKEPLVYGTSRWHAGTAVLALSSVILIFGMKLEGARRRPGS